MPYADPENRRAFQRRNYHRKSKDERRYMQPEVREKTTQYWRERKFGVTHEQYQEMHAAQGGLCAICQQPETVYRSGVLKTLAVDHDHESGAVRGLLCSRCNTALGLLGEDPDRIEAAGIYLRRDRYGA